MCHESSGIALKEAIGIGAVKLDDFDKADLIIVVGQNPGTNHPRMLTALRDAKKNGASIVSINPLIETGMIRFKHPQNPLEVLGYGTEISDEHVRVSLNGDQALFRGFAKVILERSLEHSGFISTFTKGYDDYAKVVRNTSWDLIYDVRCRKKRNREDWQFDCEVESHNSCWAMGLDTRNLQPSSAWGTRWERRGWIVPS